MVGLSLSDLTDKLAKSEVYQSIHFSVNETLVATSTMRDAMPRILRTIGQSFGWQLGMYWSKITELDTPCLKLASSWQSPLFDSPEFIKVSEDTTFCVGESLPGRVWASGTPVWMLDFDEQTFVRSTHAKKAELKTAIAFPIYSDLEIVGVMEFFSHSNGEHPDPHLLEVLVNIGYRIGQFQHKRSLERDLADANARYRVMIDSSFSGVVIADKDGVIVEWNPAAEEMFGWKKGEMLGKNLLTIIPERFREAHTAGISRIKADDHTYGSRVVGKRTNLTGLHKDGSEFPITLSLSTWNTSGRRFFGGILRKGE